MTRGRGTDSGMDTIIGGIRMRWYQGVVWRNLTGPTKITKTSSALKHFGRIGKGWSKWLFKCGACQVFILEFALPEVWGYMRIRTFHSAFFFLFVVFCYLTALAFVVVSFLPLLSSLRMLKRTSLSSGCHLTASFLLCIFRCYRCCSFGTAPSVLVVVDVAGGAYVLCLEQQVHSGLSHREVTLFVS